MIRRIMPLKLVDGADAKAVGEACIDAMRVAFPEARIDLGLPADAPSTRSWDLCLVVELPDAQSHQRIVHGGPLELLLKRVLRDQVVVRKGWSFEVPKRR